VKRCSEPLMCEVKVTPSSSTIASLPCSGGVPPHPGDEGAQAGGMVALNAGGTRAVKYGVTRNYVKGLEGGDADRRNYEFRR